ncbi:MAG: hypothetical protein M1828_000933 [Chrysothrix sp. TS-e1954]|nr:MAG: hypothetical protein M1828_000933 [Chrysothrix sp. TS-e1954]
MSFQDTSAGPSQQQTSLRPRTKRHITGLEEFAPDNTAPISQVISSGTPFDSPFQSRAASPIPSKHPSRPPSTRPVERNLHLNTSPKRRDFLAPQPNNDLANSLSGLWGKSWTSLQGLASNVLGSDASTEMIKDKSPQRQRRPFEATHSRTGDAPRQWGPQAREESQPGAGSKTQRQDLVRERKRQELLSTNGTLTPNTAKYKRRTSDEFDSTSAPPGEDDDREALVYIHHVTRMDTLAGIAIKFSSQPAIIKKANRLWSNDAIQTRKTIVIPVDSCEVRCRPVVPEEDHLTSQDGTLDAEGTPRPPASASFLVPTHTSSTLTPANPLITSQLPIPPSPSLSQRSRPSNPDENPPWKHDSWVLLPNTPASQPIEIARMSRRDLGYFPRARRKASHSFSDLDTPSLSLELPRPSLHSATVSDTSPPPTGVNAINSAKQQPKHRHRSSSSASQKQWATVMLGPGGVGTLTGKGVSAPGPSEDKLNKVLKKHLPNLAPPPALAAWEEDDYAPGTIHQSYSSGGTSLENVGGAIEGWVRKLAKSTAKALDQAGNSASGPAGSSSPRSDSRRRLPRTFSAQPQQNKRDITGLTPGTGGDLIELSSAFEVGDDDDDEGEDEDEYARGDPGKQRQIDALAEEQNNRGRSKRADSTGVAGPSARSSRAGAGAGAGAVGSNTQQVLMMRGKGTSAGDGKRKGD